MGSACSRNSRPVEWQLAGRGVAATVQQAVCYFPRRNRIKNKSQSRWPPLCLGTCAISLPLCASFTHDEHNSQHRLQSSFSPTNRFQALLAGVTPDLAAYTISFWINLFMKVDTGGHEQGVLYYASVAFVSQPNPSI